jgi:NAD-dependent dihydropyrimidine dehydrogenase PreA subunit
MKALAEHPTVRQFDEKLRAGAPGNRDTTLEAERLRDLCLEAGADDVGFVEIGRAEIADQREDILAALPGARTLVSFVCRMSRAPIQTPFRSVANLEFHHTSDHVNEVGRRIVAALGKQGVRALVPAMGFPMEMDRFPGKTWVVSHKPVAVAAGLGHMGIHRNVIHPRFGNFILLGTVITDAEVHQPSAPIDWNPCLECKLCVAACPVGAIGSDGRFDFSACLTHNYREFMGGFTNWVEQIAESGSATGYRARVNDSESASMWQSLSFGASYKSAYCMAVCPAGEEVIGPFLQRRAEYLQTVVRPLQDKKEPLYVVPGSDAETYAARRFPHKTLRRVGNGLRPRSIGGFLRGLPLTFQRNRSEGMDVTLHFTFTGDESAQATVVIRDKAVTVSEGHKGSAQLHVTADTATWLGFLAKERSLVWALLRRRIRLRGSPRVLLAFGRCFPS